MMTFKTDAYTDMGTRKKVNQDAILLKQAKTRSVGKICFACLCDGMGGLSSGEVASSAFVTRMDRWFINELPVLLSDEGSTEVLSGGDSNTNIWKLVRIQWERIVQEMNMKIAQYGKERDIKLGTTVVMILLMNGQYLVMSVGDSRVYTFDKQNLRCITHDHSYVQQQMDEGKMTAEEAERSDKKSLLLQCVGASPVVTPDFYKGEYSSGRNYLLCSDGLWRKLIPEEIVSISTTRNGIKHLVERVKNRGETDNISGLVISV